MKATISTLIEAVVLFTVLQAQRVCAVEAQGGTVSGSDILVPAGKWIVEATSGSNSDTAVLTVVSTEKILAGGEEGPVMVLEDDAVQLDAIPYPSGETYPQGCPVWSVNQKPAGSSIPKPTDGDKTVSVTPDKLGKYKILADYARIDLYSYRFEFEKRPDTHASVEGYKDGVRMRHWWPRGIIDFSTHLGGKYASKNIVDSPGKDIIHLAFDYTTNGAMFVADYAPGATNLQASGEVEYDVYLNLGDASGVPVFLTTSWVVSGDISPLSPLIHNGAGPASIKDGDDGVMYYQKTLLKGTGLFHPPPPHEKGKSPSERDGNFSGRAKIGEVKAGVAYEDWGEAQTEGKVDLKVDYNVRYRKGN